MLTPQELQEKKFAKAVFGGYDMGEVDAFLDEVTADYEKLFKEAAVLKSKLKILAEKIEEYRSVDEEMRRTLAAAKRTSEEQTAEAKKRAEETVAEADRYAAETRADADSYSERLLAEARAGAQELAERTKRASENMLETARAEAMERLGGLRAELEREEKRLEAARAESRRFAAEAAELSRRQLEVLRELMEISPAAAPGEPARAAWSEITPPKQAEPAPAPAAAAQDDDFSTKRIPVEGIRITERHAAEDSAAAAHAADDDSAATEEDAAENYDAEQQPTVRFEAIRRVDVGGETVEIGAAADELSDDDAFRQIFGGDDVFGTDDGEDDGE